VFSKEKIVTSIVPFYVLCMALNRNYISTNQVAQTSSCLYYRCGRTVHWTTVLVLSIEALCSHCVDAAVSCEP